MSVTPQLWEKIKHLDLESMLIRLGKAKDDEKMATLMVRMHLLMEEAEKILHVTKIDRYKFEYQVEGSRIDLLLFHADGGVSVVELKANGQPREIVAGVGQVCMYAIKVRRTVKINGQPPKYINKILAAPVSGFNSGDLIEICEMAGVKFRHLGTHEDLQKILTKVVPWAVSLH